jgi:predicted CoA-binding protein
MKKKTLVLGASENPARYSNMAISRLVDNGVEVVALGLKQGEAHGVTIVNENFPFENVHTVTLYLNPTRQKPYYEYILSLQPQRVIFNPGTENPEFFALLRDNNIEVEIACTLVLLGTNQY